MQNIVNSAMLKNSTHLKSLCIVSVSLFRGQSLVVEDLFPHLQE